MLCQYCGKEINRKPSLVAHEMSCKDNPDRVTHRHSPDAGVKKGTLSPLKGRKVGRNSVWDREFSLSQVMIEGSTYPRHRLKARIIDGGLLEYKCACCGIGPEWCGKPMPLILDHINGINNDNRIENLRFVCSNCDSQLSTYKSKNRMEKLAESA